MNLVKCVFFFFFFFLSTLFKMAPSSLALGCLEGGEAGSLHKAWGKRALALPRNQNALLSVAMVTREQDHPRLIVWR